MSAAIALIVCTFASLMFASTRGIGILGLAVLFMLFPVVTPAIVVVLGIAFLLYHFRKGD